MIISTALPKVAFRRPPTICPVCADIASVAAPRMEASGTMAMKLQPKTIAEFQPISGAIKPSGTKTRRKFNGFMKTLYQACLSLSQKVIDVPSALVPCPTA